MKKKRLVINTLNGMGYQVLDYPQYTKVRLITRSGFVCEYVITDHDVLHDDNIVERVVRSLNKLIIKNL